MVDADIAPLQEFFLHNSGAGTNGWEIHRPQPTIIKLVEQGIFHGEVLDIGCGLGDNSIYIKKHAEDVKVTAIDFASKAIEISREKAQKENVNIQYEVVNMLEDLSMTNLKQHSFDVILDSAIFHIFSNEDRPRYIKNLEYLIKAGGLYIQLCFSEKEIRKGGPRRIKKSDLYEIFSCENGWSIDSLEDTTYESRPEVPLSTDGRAYLTFIRYIKSISS